MFGSKTFLCLKKQRLANEQGKIQHYNNIIANVFAKKLRVETGNSVEAETSYSSVRLNIIKKQLIYIVLTYLTVKKPLLQASLMVMRKPISAS